MEEFIKMLPRYRVPVVEKKQNKRKTHEEYVAELAIKNPTVEVVDKYINAKTKIAHRCLIDGHEWMAKPNNILNGKSCPKCAGNILKTHEEYVEEVKVINPDIQVIAKYINARTSILHKCIKHNIEWMAYPYDILNGTGCCKCGYEKIGDKARKTHEQYVAELSQINLNVIVVGTYQGANAPILHRCLIDNHEWHSTPARLLTGNGCPKCAGNMLKTHEQYIYEVSLINPDIEVLDEYINSHTAILHRCKKDNHQWYTAPTNIMSGCGCPRCYESSGERQIRQWLEKRNISYVFQKTFDNCRDIHPLPFDFYLPDYNTCVEYDDRQHFKPVEHFGGEEKFQITVKHDNFKNQYCIDNNIRILRIPYYKNIEEELNNFLFI